MRISDQLLPTLIPYENHFEEDQQPINLNDGRSEKLFTILLFLYYMTPFGQLLFADQIANNASGSPPSNQALGLALQIGINGTAACLLLRRYRTLLRGIRQAAWVVLLPALACMSVIWSASPFITLKHAIMVAIGTSFGAYLGARYSRMQILRLLSYSVGIAAILSVLFALFMPSMGLAHEFGHAGNWQGIFHQKNMLGRVMVLGALTFLIARPLKKANVMNVSGLLICVGLVFLSRSATSLIAFLIVIIVVPMSRTLKLPATVGVPIWMAGMAIVSVLALFVIHDSGSALLLFGRDSTLTGRTHLWEAVISAIWNRPWLGYGLDGFWHGMEGESRGAIIMARWAANFSHNGILDLALQFGIAGIVLFASGLCYSLYHGLRCARFDRNPANVWPLSYLAFYIVFNISESSGMVNSIFWLLYVSAAAGAVQRSTMNIGAFVCKRYSMSPAFIRTEVI